MQINVDKFNVLNFIKTKRYALTTRQREEKLKCKRNINFLCPLSLYIFNNKIEELFQ